MSDFGEISYSSKKTAVRKAAEEVTQALNTISDIFKTFQEDYLALLLDNENLRSLLKKSSPPDPQAISKILQESPKKAPSPPPRVPSPIILSQEDDPETPGIVETTQFPIKPRPTPSKLHRPQPKKALFPPFKDHSAVASTSETPRKPQPPSRILSLSKKNVQTRINSSGKVDKQSKLVLQPLSQKTDINSIKNTSLNTTNVDPRDLEIDETMFEKALTQERAEVINLSPNRDNSRKKGRLRLKSKVESLPKPKAKPQSPHDDIVLSDFEMEEMEPSLTQIEKEAITQSRKKEKKQGEKENQERSEPAVRVNTIDLDCEEESRADPDETFFPRGETSSRGMQKENATRKRLPEDDGLVDKATDKIFDMDVDGDWDTDVSMDKWTSPPSKKLMDSFDVVPEKKDPNFAYKGPAVRGKNERAKLRGWSCKDCQVYYENMNLTEEELKKRMDQCSRHRSKYNEKYNTPPGFWNPVFDNTPASQQTIRQ
ncbi:DNA endonuclease RBBP8 isoform X2 [Diachasma alloeum]|nr:DNA endonuclease RBBP8 isoform X2 [Diachasma alloeum]